MKAHHTYHQAVGDAGHRVDVIIPTRNRARLTAEAIASVQAQTFDDWHLHVVDDASDDDTVDRIRSLTADDERITLHRRDTRGGGNPARQTALAASAAPLVATLDSDDLWEPTKLARQVARWDEVPGRADPIGVVLCWHDAVDGAGAPRAAVPRAGRRWHPFTAFNTSTPVFSRAVLEEAGGFAPPGRYPLRTTDHVELFLRVTRRHAMATVPEVLVHCRHHGEARNSDGERTLAAADEARDLQRDLGPTVDDDATRAWLDGWVAGRYLELGEHRAAWPHVRGALRTGGPAVGARILAHYGPWAVRRAVRRRTAP